MHRGWVVRCGSFGLLALLVVALALGAERPAQDLRLVVQGGPAAVDVEILVNGELTYTVEGEDVATFEEITDLLKPGLNEMSVRLKQPAAPRSGGDALRISIAPIQESGSRIRMSGHHVAGFIVPAESAGVSAPCEEKIPFWGSPPAAPPAGLKDDYWLLITGPPAKNRVTVKINDVVVASAATGHEIVEVSHAVVAGKNTVAFDLSPTCITPPSSREGLLDLAIGPAAVENEVLEFSDTPGVLFQMDPKRQSEPKTVTRTLRVR